MTEYIPEEIYGMVRIYVYGSVQYMLEWLMNDRDLSPEKVAEIWEHSLPEPLNAGKIAELTGLDRKVVDKAMAAMKKDGSIVSPVRCKWEPADK